MTRTRLGQANLFLANLTGTTRTDLTWWQTICPDGTSSGPSASMDVGTCEGHL